MAARRYEISLRVLDFLRLVVSEYADQSSNFTNFICVT